MVVLLGRRSKVLPAIGGPCRGRRIPRGAVAPLGTFPRLSRRCGIAALARLAPLALLLLLAAGRGSEQGRRWAAPVNARHAGRVPALPPPAWARSSVAPPERRGEAGCPSPVATVEAADAARFVPPVFSSSFSGARAKRKRLRIDGLHSPTAPVPPLAAAASQERAQAVRSGRPHSLLSAPLGSG